MISQREHHAFRVAYLLVFVAIGCSALFSDGAFAASSGCDAWNALSPIVVTAPPPTQTMGGTDYSFAVGDIITIRGSPANVVQTNGTFLTAPNGGRAFADANGVISLTIAGGFSSGQFTYNLSAIGEVTWTFACLPASIVSNTSVSSSANPSNFGQLVTFTATVTGISPTGSITFKDGTTVLTTVPLNVSGTATFTTSSLGIGTHSITAEYSGDANNRGSASAVLIQAVGVSPESVRLQALQIAVTQLVAQSSGNAISSSVEGAIAEGFDDNGKLIAGNNNGVRFNFAADPERRSQVEDRVGDTFAALGYERRARVLKPSMSKSQSTDWLLWADVRGTNWSTNLLAGDIRGGQTNALGGLTRRLDPNFLIGAFGGYETFDYSSRALSGRMSGDGWTVGGYAGWRLLPGLRFDTAVAHSTIGYDGQAGVARSSFTGQRWWLTTGLTGNHKTASGLEIDPSAKVFALWEGEGAYIDNLGIQHDARNFSTGRASGGAKVAYPWLLPSDITIAPYAGLYADYYFNDRGNTALLGAPNLLPAEYVQGLSARATLGLAVSVKNGGSLSVGSELGGIGNDFKVWTVRGRASAPF